MTNRAVATWHKVVRDLTAAVEIGTLEAATKAIDGTGKLNPLQLPSATFKKLVKEHKVGLLVAEAFCTIGHKDPLAYAAFAAGAVLDSFLSQASESMLRGQPPAPFNSPAAGSLAAEVSRQLQQSGVLQQLPRALTAMAQQLEACAADPAVSAAAWALTSEPGHWAVHAYSPQAHAILLLKLFRLLLPLCDAEHAQQLLAAAAPPAARTCLLLLQAVSAAMQLYDPLSPKAEEGLQCMGEYPGAVQLCGQLLLDYISEGLGSVLNDEPWLQDTHLYQFNIALAAAANLKLQHDCSTASTGTSSGSSGDMARSSSSSAGGLVTTGDGGLAAVDPDHAAAAAWQRSCEVMSAFETGPQQLLFEQLGVDPRVVVWGICSGDTYLCFLQGMQSVLVHTSLFTARASSARQQWLHQQQEQQRGQQQEQQRGHQPQQEQQQQQGHHQEQQQQLTSHWPVELCLNSLLLAVMMPGRLPPQQMFTPMHGITPFSMGLTVLDLLTHLPGDTCAAAAAAAAAVAQHADVQGVPLQACLEKLVRNLLLLSKHLDALARQQQQAAAASGGTSGSGTNSSSSMGTSSSGSAGGVHSDSHAASIADEVAAGTMLVATALYRILRACTQDLGPAAACVVCPEGGQQQQQQQPFVELLRPELENIAAHFDSCACVLAATKVSTARAGEHSADCLQSALEACSYAASQGIPAVIGLASQSGFNSREQRQLFSLQASLLKLSANLKNGNGSSSSSGSGNSMHYAEQQQHARACTLGAAKMAATVIRQGMASNEAAATAADAATAGPANQQEQAAAAAATQRPLLPSLVIFGRACLQWAQELQEQATELQQAERAALLGAHSAAEVCCSGFAPLSQLTGEQESDLAGNQLIRLLDMFQTWLGQQHVSAELAAAGYNPQELLQQLELLSAAPAAAAATAAAGQQPLTEVLQPLVEQLQVVGTALSSLAVPVFCNNPTCSNVSGPTELHLVSGRSCVCAGCRIARYCSRACIRQHWGQHGPVCHALAAAAAAVGAE